MFFSKLKGVAMLLMVGGTIAAIAAPVKIVTVNDNFASIAKSVGGDLVQVESLVQGSRNMHNIQPKPSMVVKVRRADMIVRLGMSQDAWVDGLIHVARNPKLFLNASGYVDASSRIKKLEVPTKDIDGSQGDIHKEGNPHYWLNPLNGIVIANHIRDQLSRIDPENQAAYQKNAAQFGSAIQSKMARWNQRLTAVKSSQFLTYHTVWSYFFDAFDLANVGTLELFPGVPPTIQHIQTLQSTLSDTSRPTIVLTAVYYPKKMGQRFASTTGGQFFHLSTDVGSAGVTTYEGLFDYLIEELTK
jgi:ABC-type Zn uptake system ZnuABC Zn-binding protein ZnuA